MKLLDRRQIVLGAAGLGACASPSIDECDPARGGFARGLACQDQYRERERQGVERVRMAEARVMAAQQEQRRLIQDRDRLRATLSTLNSRISTLNLQCSRLEQRANYGLNDRATIQAFISDLQAALRDYDAGAAEAIGFQPPYYLYADGARALGQAQNGVTVARAEARNILARLGQIAVEFAAGQIAQEAVVRFLRWALTRLGLAFLNPLVGAAATLADIIGAIELAIDLHDAFDNG